jgi:probable F420-dependent oxidoreductase
MAEPAGARQASAGRWGITVPLPGVPLLALRELLPELASLGYTDAWSAETNGADAFTPLVLAADHAPRLRLGTAAVPVYTRGPALLAMSAAALAELAPGRFALGIGASSPAIVEDWNGGEFAEPYQRVRDTLRFLRRALAGARMPGGFRLERPPRQPPPILLAALRPGMLRLAAREADGAITNWLSAQDVRRVRAELGDEPELAARIFVCPTEDAGTARALGRRLIAAYLTVGVYAAFHDWLGRGEILAPLHRAWAAGDRAGALAAIPDEVVDDLVVHGSPDACRDQILRYVENGLTTPVIALVTTGADPIAAARALRPSGE